MRIYIYTVSNAPTSFASMIASSNNHRSILQEFYFKLCTIEVDLPHLWITSGIHTIGTGSGVHYRVYYDLVIVWWDGD